MSFLTLAGGDGIEPTLNAGDGFLKQLRGGGFAGLGFRILREAFQFRELCLGLTLAVLEVAVFGFRVAFASDGAFE